MRLCFICHGNICRSTMAQCIMQHLVEQAGLKDQFVIDSAGVSDEEEGNPVHHGTVNMLCQAGIPVIPHAARKMTRNDLGRFDLFICMEEVHVRSSRRILGLSADIRKLLDFTDTPGDIDDPWYSGNFKQAFDEIMKGCHGLLSALEAPQGRTL